MQQFNGMRFVDRNKPKPKPYSTPKKLIRESEKYMSEVIRYVE